MDITQATHVRWDDLPYERLNDRLKRRYVMGQHLTLVDVAAGEVLVLPSHLPHSAEALEDSMVCDAFSPIRADWVEKRDDYLRR